MSESTGWTLPAAVSLVMDDLRANGLPEDLWARVEHRLSQAYYAGYDEGYNDGYTEGEAEAFQDGLAEGYDAAMEDCEERRARGIR